MNDLVLWKNGRAESHPEPYLKFLDTSQSFRGVYESIRTYHRQPFRLDDHLQRLEDSANRMALSFPRSLHQTQRDLLGIVASAPFDPQFLKLVVTANEVLIFSRMLEIPPGLYEGVKVITASATRQDVLTKSLDVRAQHQARAQLQAHRAYEALIVNEAGEIPEEAFSNLFWVREGRLFTHRSGALHGITQAAVIEVAEKENPVSEGLLTSSSVSSVDELFLTQTSKGIVPILQVDDKIIGNGTMGPLTQLLMERFEALVQSECPSPSTNRS